MPETYLFGLSPNMIYLGGSTGLGGLLLNLRALGEVLADVPGSETPVLSPVRVPIGAVRATGAPILAASNRLEPVRHLPVPGGLLGRKALAVAVQQEPTNENHEPSKVVLIESPDGADKVPVYRHERVGLS
jgi:hypothetical protein